MYAKMITRGAVAIIVIALLIGIYVRLDHSLFDSKQGDNQAAGMTMPEKGQGISGYAAVHVSPERVQLLGLSTDTVQVRSLEKHIRTVGVVEVDETSVSIIQTKFNGWIEDLYVNFVGMPVKKGQPLFTVYSPELLATQEEYLLALHDVDRKREGQFAQELQRFSVDLLKATQQRLQLWDISDDQIVQLKKSKNPTRTLTFHAPSDGIVITTQAFAGMNVQPGMKIFTIADLSRIWVLADIYENDIAFMKLGQEGSITTLSLPGQKITGNITFIDYVTDASTRTVKVRFECDNADFILKPDMYAVTEIDIDMGKALALPEEALIDTGVRKIVFVALGKGHYEPREVKVGFKAGPYYQLLSGVVEGEEIVTSAQFLLDSESRLKAFGTSMKGHGM